MSIDSVQFVEFGNILTKEKRKRLVEYIEKTMKREEIHRQEFSDLTPYTEQIDKIFSQQATLNIITVHPDIAKQIMSEILQLFQKNQKEFNLNNPYSAENQELDCWKQKSHEDVLDNNVELFTGIRKIYSEKEFETNFYEKTAANEYEKLKKDKHRLDALVEAILDSWERHILEKESKFQLELIEKKRAEYCKQLYEQIEKFRCLKEVLLPFTNELGRLWDLSSGIWQKTNLNVLTKYAEFLENEQSIRKLAEMLGRMKSDERELEEQERNVKIFKNEWQTEHASKAELVGICESDDLNNLLPSEIALLSDKSLETSFFKKYSEKKLMTFEYEAKILAQKEETIKQKQFRPKKKEKGPIILCIDTSGSMHGEPEQVAKAVAFAVLRVALRDKRQCYLISFSTQIETLKLGELKDSLLKILDFLAMSFYGGTDAEPALKEALRQIKEEEYKDADILVISDFIMDNLSPEISDKIIEAKKMKNRFYSLVISPNANEKTLSVFDNNWIYDLNGPNRIRELVLSVRKVTGNIE